MILLHCLLLTHMNSVKWPCSPWVLVAQWIESTRHVFGRSWVQFLSRGTRIFLWPTLVSCWLIYLSHLPALLSFCFDWEVISNTWDSVSSAIQTSQIWSKYSAEHHILNSSSLCLDTQMKHCLFCLIY